MSSFTPGGFGCTGNAFSYTTLANNGGSSKNAEADALNPNLYCSIDELKDNRRLENMYDEIQKRASLARSNNGRRSMGEGIGQNKIKDNGVLSRPA